MKEPIHSRDPLLDPLRFHLGKIGISAYGRQKTFKKVENYGLAGTSGYICVTNSRTVYLANRDAVFCEIQNKSLLTVPDGAPLVMMARKLGFPDVERVTGPALMMEMLCKSSALGFSHYFYGGSEQTIGRIRSRLVDEFPDVSVKGTNSPPFQSVDEFDLDALANEVNELGPTFFWCGLGAPKQEILIARLAPKLSSTLCIGVGLAFDYFAGTVQTPPGWAVKMKLEWLYRCAQQPVRARRFIFPFFSTIWMMTRVFLAKRP